MSEPLAVGSMFGPYRLDRLIGRGGMGEVYQAYDTVKDRTVAIKVLPERMADDPVYRQRFQRESHAAARLREAHVIPIHDYGEIDGRLFIDMRLVDGDNLRSLLHRAGPGSPERAVGVITQVAAALDAAHAEGLLHRDIKPDNILLTRDGFAYLVDFGIAQSSTDAALTSTGAAVGSYRYMAPERFAASTLTPAADVYGLACVLFECLTGTRPYSGETDAEVMRAHLFDPIPRPSLVRPTVPGTFDTVIGRGMAKNPNERYSSAGELAEAAARAVTDTGPWSVVTQGQRTGTGPSQPSVGPDQPASEPTLPGSNTWWQSGGTQRSGSQPLPSYGPRPVAPGTNPVHTGPDSLRSNSGEGSGPRPTGPTANLKSPAVAQDSTPQGTAGSATGSGTTDTGTGHLPTDPSGERPVEGGRPRRGRLVLTMLAVIVLAVASVGFAGWAWTQQVRPGTAVGDASALRGADIPLLSMIQSSGYKRASCRHTDGDATTTALITCVRNMDASIPLAQFRTFADADALHDFYNDVVLSAFRTDGCAGSAASRDAASIVDEKEVGRKACYDDLTLNPTRPNPVLVLTNEASLALAFYIWDADEKPLRDYAAKIDHAWQFSAPGKGTDPDFFTEADRALLENLGSDYTAGNCIHYDVPAGALANSIVGCAAAIDNPSVAFYGFPNAEYATKGYQSQLAQGPGHACGGTGSDEIWRKSDGPVGRFFCYPNTAFEPERLCLMGIHDRLQLTFMVCVLATDNPEKGPKTEQELLAWFNVHFGPG